MRVVLFAHTPPPHHGQSYMVELLLRQLGGDQANHARAHRPSARHAGIELFHVNVRLSDDADDIGRARPAKLLRIVHYAVQAIGYRWKYGADSLLYVPAPGKRAALYRDWLVMLLTRPFFRRRIYYWHAAGMADWLATSARSWEHLVTRLLLGRPELSIVLGEAGRPDAMAVSSRQVRIVPNAIPDPCPDGVEDLIASREQRAKARALRLRSTRPAQATVETILFRVLFLGLCTREKGLFDALDAMALLNLSLQRDGKKIAVELLVAGQFVRAAEREEFEQRIRDRGLQRPDTEGSVPVVRYVGFVTGERKRRLLEDADVLCFPTYYAAESFGLVVVDAMAHALPVVATRWRTIPEILPAGYPWLVDARSPEALASAMERLLTESPGRELRERFVAEFTLERWTSRVRSALLELERDAG